MATVARASVALDKLSPEELEMARQRPHLMSKSLKSLSDEVYLSHDDPFIDFSSAGLYLVGLQTTVATVVCAATSVASCWLMPAPMISAVRTLVITCVMGFIFMRKPIRVGRVRGVTTIFNALRPAVLVYITLLTVEQLVHTCVASDQRPNGYSRKLIFHCNIALMAAAGLWRAAKPFSETDAPFLITAFSGVTVAMLPPPAAPLSGPLCEGASLFGAGERLMRAFLFSALYVIHVYCSPPQRNTIHDLAVCIMRCAAAAVWILGCHTYVLWVALIQAVVALWARFGSDPGGSTTTNYSSVETRSDGGLSDAELGSLNSNTPFQLERDANGVLVAPYLRDSQPPSYNGFSNPEPILEPASSSPPPPSTEYGFTSAMAPLQRAMSPPPSSGGVPVDARQLAQLVGTGGGSALSRERMAQIASAM